MSIAILPILLFSAALGSFLNVVVLRFPEQPLTGRSHCPKCKKQLSALELIPIFSYLFLRGRCTKCHTKISLQYPLVELAVSVIATFMFISFLKNPINPAVPLVQFLIIYVLLVLFLIDLRTFLLPDLHISILTGLVILNLFLISSSVISSATGALIGFGILLFLWIITSHHGIGLGDVKLMIPLGLLFGPANTILLLFNSFIIGGLIGLLLIIFKKATLKTAIPFGPFLAGVAIMYILFPQIPQYLLALLV